MRVNVPPISEHRLQRFQRWMLLWLKWFAAFLREARAFAPFSRQATATAHRWLDYVEGVAIDIAIIRAAPHMRFPNAVKRPPRRRRSQHRRAIIGAAMRRALRSNDLLQRIAALSDLDALTARLLKRLPCGLTRRRSHPTRPDSSAVPRAQAHVAAALFADTS
jgi:hypothetical protein